MDFESSWEWRTSGGPARAALSGPTPRGGTRWLVVADFFAVGDGEEAAEGFGRSVFVKGGGVAVGEEGEGDIGMGAGDSWAGGWVDGHRYLVEVQVARLHPVDAGVEGFDDENGVGCSVFEVCKFDGFRSRPSGFLADDGDVTGFDIGLASCSGGATENVDDFSMELGIVWSVPWLVEVVFVVENFLLNEW